MVPQPNSWKLQRNPAKALVYCQKPGGCRGTCPLSVGRHHQSLGKPPVCRECGRKYTIPSEKDYPSLPRAPPGKRETPQQKLERTERENKELKKKLDQAQAANKQAEKPKADPAQSPTEPSVETLQKLLEFTKEANLDTADVEAKLEQAKAKASASKATPPNLMGVMRQLTAANNTLKQLTEQALKDEEKLALTKRKLEEAAAGVAELRNERDALLKEEGATNAFAPEALLPADLVPAGGLSPDFSNSFGKAAKAAIRDLFLEMLKQTPEPMEGQEDGASNSSKESTPSFASSTTPGEQPEGTAQLPANPVPTGPPEQEQQGDTASLPTAASDGNLPANLQENPVPATTATPVTKSKRAGKATTEGVIQEAYAAAKQTGDNAYQPY